MATLHYVDFRISIKSSRSRLLNGGIAALRYDVFVPAFLEALKRRQRHNACG